MQGKFKCRSSQLQQKHRKQVSRWEFDSVVRLPDEETVLYYFKSGEILSFYYIA